MTTNHLKIALVGPLTGPRSDYGNIIKNVLNYQKKIYPTIEWNLYDDEAEPEAAEKAAKLIIEGGYDCAIGHFNSYCALRVKPIYQKNMIPLILPASSHQDLNDEPHDFIYRMCPDNILQASLVIEFSQNKKKSLRVIHDGSKYGRELSSIFKKRNIETISLSKVISNNVDGDLYYIAGTHHGCADIINEMRSNGVCNEILGCDDCHIDHFIHLLNDTPSKIFVIGLKNNYKISLSIAMDIVGKFASNMAFSKFLENNKLFGNNNIFRGTCWSMHQASERGFSVLN